MSLLILCLVTFTKSTEAKAKLASASRTATAYVGLFRSWRTAHAHNTHLLGAEGSMSYRSEGRKLKLRFYSYR